MIYFPVIFLAIVQGLTEFLPISSSGHLVLTHHFMNDGSDITSLNQKIMDIAVHVGTLMAVMLYFWRDVFAMVCGVFDNLRCKKTNESQLVNRVILSSIPIMIVGYVIFKMDVTMFDSVHVIAWTTLVFGVLLYISDKFPQRSIKMPTKTQAIAYGIFQCLALVPGVSRSGITMTAGRFMGHDRTNAARYSMLMGMVAICGAGLLISGSLIGSVSLTSDFWMILAVGAATSCIAAYITIVVMMRWIKSASFTPFVVYRICLGLILLGLIYGGIIPQDM